MEYYADEGAKRKMKRYIFEAKQPTSIKKWRIGRELVAANICKPVFWVYSVSYNIIKSLCLLTQ